MGFVFQFYNLMPVLTAVENVELPLLVARVPAPARRAARRSRRSSWSGSASARRTCRTSSPAASGSASTIARALVNDPAIVWADEPTGDLDSENAAEIVALMRRLNRERGLTFLIVTHDISRRPRDRPHRAHGRRRDRRRRTAPGGALMVARVTLAEIDAVRMSIDSALELYRTSVMPALHAQDGYEGCYVLTTPEGKALVVTFWSDEDAADAGLESGHYARAGRRSS